MGKQSVFTLDLKEKRTLSAYRALLFFLVFKTLEAWLALKGIFIVSLINIPLSFFAFFFPLWEFLFYLSYLKKEFSFWLAGITFFVLLFAFLYSSFAFIFVYLFFLILFLEREKKTLSTKIFFVVIALSIFFIVSSIPLFLFVLLPKKFLVRFALIDSLEIVSV